jgi:hypothetical protein
MAASIPMEHVSKTAGIAEDQPSLMRQQFATGAAAALDEDLVPA